MVPKFQMGTKVPQRAPAAYYISGNPKLVYCQHVPMSQQSSRVAGCPLLKVWLLSHGSDE